MGSTPGTTGTADVWRLMKMISKLKRQVDALETESVLREAYVATLEAAAPRRGTPEPEAPAELVVAMRSGLPSQTIWISVGDTKVLALVRGLRAEGDRDRRFAAAQVVRHLSGDAEKGEPWPAIGGMRQHMPPDLLGYVTQAGTVVLAAATAATDVRAHWRALSRTYTARHPYRTLRPGLLGLPLGLVALRNAGKVSRQAAVGFLTSTAAVATATSAMMLAPMATGYLPESQVPRVSETMNPRSFTAPTGPNHRNRPATSPPTRAMPGRGKAKALPSFPASQPTTTASPQSTSTAPSAASPSADTTTPPTMGPSGATPLGPDGTASPSPSSTGTEPAPTPAAVLSLRLGPLRLGFLGARSRRSWCQLRSRRRR